LDHDRRLQRLFVTRSCDLYLAITFDGLLRVDNPDGADPRAP
jgi:hypothetical protein